MHDLVIRNATVVTGDAAGRVHPARVSPSTTGA
jgi:hypothetical protein